MRSGDTRVNKQQEKASFFAALRSFTETLGGQISTKDWAVDSQMIHRRVPQYLRHIIGYEGSVQDP